MREGDAVNAYRSIWTYLFETPHRLDWVSVDGVQTRFLEAGKKGAPVVIMLHGLAGSLENFCANVAAHAEHFHVFAIDLLGCGWNDRPPYPYTFSGYVEHLRGFMDAMGISSASLIGVSLGSAVSAMFARQYPERTTGVIMVTPAGLWAHPDERDASIKKARESRQGAVDNPTWENAFAMFKRLILHEEQIIDDLVAVRLSIYSTPEFKAAMPYLMAVTEEAGMDHEEWRKIDSPMLIVAAPDGQSSYYENARLIHALTPNSRMVSIEDVDHWAQFEAADTFNPLSIAFIKEAAAREPA